MTKKKEKIFVRRADVFKVPTLNTLRPEHLMFARLPVTRTKCVGHPSSSWANEFVVLTEPIIKQMHVLSDCLIT